MEILVWLLPGALIGWTAGALLRCDSPQDVSINLVVGTIGAATGCWLLGPLLGVPMQAGAIGAANLQMAILGSILLLAAVKLLAPAKARNAAMARPARSGTTTGEQQAAGG